MPQPVREDQVNKVSPSPPASIRPTAWIITQPIWESIFDSVKYDDALKHKYSRFDGGRDSNESSLKGNSILEQIEKKFAAFANRIAKLAGSSVVFFVAASVIIVWAMLGPFFGFSPGWQTIISTVTSISTFLMVFLIQNSQNRDGLALQIKLNELIRAQVDAKDEMIDLENLSHAELEVVKAKFGRMGKRARIRSQKLGGK